MFDEWNTVIYNVTSHVDKKMFVQRFVFKYIAHLNKVPARPQGDECEPVAEHLQFLDGAQHVVVRDLLQDILRSEIDSKF